MPSLKNTAGIEKAEVKKPRRSQCERLNSAAERERLSLNVQFLLRSASADKRYNSKIEVFSRGKL